MQWPNERQWVTAGLFWLAVFMLVMGMNDPTLWRVDTFKSLLQAVVITGLLNMVAAFHFSANKSDADKTASTKAAFDAITATANSKDPTP